MKYSLSKEKKYWQDGYCGFLLMSRPSCRVGLVAPSSFLVDTLLLNETWNRRYARLDQKKVERFQDDREGGNGGQRNIFGRDARKTTLNNNFFKKGRTIKEDLAQRIVVRELERR